MSRLNCLGLLCLMAAPLGCSTIEVSTDYDPRANFSAMRAYAWMPKPTQPTGDPRVDNNTLLHVRIHESVEHQMTARGMERTSAERADILVGYHVAISQRLAVDTINTYYDYAPGWGWEDDRYGRGWNYSRPWDAPVADQRTIVREYEQGSLILDLVEPESNKLLWRGAARAELKPSDSPQRRQNRIDSAVRKLLQRFPPTSS